MCDKIKRVINMKTLIINGSPKTDGNTGNLIKMLKLKGISDMLNVYDMSFSPCIDCGRCREGLCIFEDDASKLINKIDEYDNIILATPLHYNQPSGPLMCLMSRNQIIFNSKRNVKPKRGGIIVTGGGDTVINSADAEKTMRIMLKSWNTQVIAYVRSLNTGRLPSHEDSKAVEAVNIMSDIMNKA